MSAGQNSRRAQAVLRRCRLAHWRFAFLAGTLLAVFNLIPVHATPSVMLGWQPSSDPNAVGYRIYYGTASQTYTKSVTVGNQTSVTLDGLAEGTTYYFSATTYNAQNQESAFSNEAVYEVPVGVATNHPPDLQVSRPANGNFTLTINGRAGERFAIEATTDFQQWCVVGTVIVGAAGPASFTDQNAPNFPQRFYRTRLLPIKRFQPFPAENADN